MTPAERLTDLLDRATTMRSNRAEALRICRQVLEESEPALPHIAARAWRVIGHSHLLDDELDDASEAYKASLRRARVLGDAALTVHALLGLGEVAQRRGLSVEALEHYGAALAIAETIGDFPSTWLIHNHLGNAHTDLGENDAAQACYDLCRETMGPDVPARKAAIVLGNIGVAYAVRGRLGPARRYFEESARRWERTEPCVGRASNLGNLGKLEVLLDRPGRGLPMLSRSIGLMASLGAKTGEMEELYKLAECQEHLGSLDEAIEALTRALELAGDIEAKKSQVRIGRSLARLHAQADRHQTAWDYERAAARLSDQLHREEHRAAMIAAEARRQAEVRAIRTGELAGVIHELRDAYETIQKLTDDQELSGSS